MHFEGLLTSLSELAVPDLAELFIFATDSSTVVLGAILLQTPKDSMVRPILYLSRTMNSAVYRFFLCRCELLTVLFALHKFSSYFLSSGVFLFLTGPQALEYPFTNKNIQNRLVRWLDFLVGSNILFQYCSGKSNKAADSLTRTQHGDRSRDAPVEADLACLPMTQSHLLMFHFGKHLQDFARFLTADLLSEVSGKTIVHLTPIFWSTLGGSTPYIE